MDNTLQKIPAAILEKGLDMTVDISHDQHTMIGKFKTLLQKLNILPKKKSFIIKPVRTGSLLKISEITMKIEVDMENLKGNDFDKKAFTLVSKYGRDMAEIIAITIVNGKADPDKKLIDFIVWNFTPSELLGAYFICRNSMDLTSFITTIFLMSGINLLMEKSPQEQGGLIASGNSLEA